MNDERSQLSRIEGLLAQILQYLKRPQETDSQTDAHRPNNPATIFGSVHISGQPIGVNVQNTPTVQAQQSGTWSVGLSGQPIQVSTVLPEYKYALISANTVGNTQVVAAVPTKRIVVVAYAVVAAGAVSVEFRSGTTTPITGTMRFVEAGGIAHQFSGGLFRTATGEALNINLSAPVQVGGYVVYLEV